MTATIEPALPRLEPELPGPGSPSRAECLAAGLRGLGLGLRSHVTVLVCPDHALDGDVARAAGALLDARVTTFTVHQPIDELAAGLRARRDGVLLACNEGVELWERTAVPMRVVGDGCGPGVLWWRAMELQEGITCRTTPTMSTCSSSTRTGCSPSR